MKEFTVGTSTPLRPDPDENSAVTTVLEPGERIKLELRLDPWSKIQTIAQDPVKRGWVSSQALTEIVGQTVKLHKEPLSAESEIVNGQIKVIVQLQNWQKVEVHINGTTKVGWIDITQTEGGPSRPSGPSQPSTPDVDLDLGINEVF